MYKERKTDLELPTVTSHCTRIRHFEIFRGSMQSAMERVHEQKKIKQTKCTKERLEKRSPLQDLNGPQNHKSRSRKSSHVSVECCSRSSNSSFSSRTHFDTQSKNFSKSTNNAPNKSAAAMPRSKQNEVLAKPLLHKSKKNEPLQLHRWQSGRKNATFASKSGQTSKLSFDHETPMSRFNKVSQNMRQKMKRPQGKPSIQLVKMSGDADLNFIDKCKPPVGRLGCGNSGLDLANVDDNKNVEEDLIHHGDNVACVRTPPIEASVSPEIQFGSHSKILVSKSEATPVCYGAGHLVSGVTDKRKCRRRGSLKAGFQKANIPYGERNDKSSISSLQDSTIPLLAGASVRWHLSPCDEGRREDEGSDLGNRLEQCTTDHGTDSVTIDLLLSSPSSICGSASDLACHNYSYSGSGFVYDAASKREDKVNLLNSQRDLELKGFTELSNKKIDKQFSATTPICSSSCNSFSLGEESCFRTCQIGNCSYLSNGSLSLENIIQTPNSDSSSDRCAGRSEMEIDQGNLVHSVLGSITPTLNREAPRLKIEMSMRDAPSFESNSIDLTQLQKNEDCVSSWASDVTLENVALSEMRISWRDGLESSVIETDEFDCCLCLSDEEIGVDDSFGEQLQMSYPKTKKENSFQGTNENDVDISPQVLDYEPVVCAKRKGNLYPDSPNTCAESICTNGGSLIASGESDWTDCFSNNFFKSTAPNWKI